MSATFSEGHTNNNNNEPLKQDRCKNQWFGMNYLRPVASSLSKHGSDTPARAKDIERFGETVVVDNPSIH